MGLQGVTAKNLYITIDPRLAASGRVKFKAREAALVATLVELKRLALQRRSKRSASQVKVAIGWLPSIVVTGGLLLKGGDSLMRPPCFGTFYYQDPESKDCSYKNRCKAEKQLRPR